MPDRTSLHVRMADEAAHVGPAPVRRELPAHRPHPGRGAAGTARTRSIPGYGFLSENADFAAACEAAGIVFIGPSAASIRTMGSKTAARRAGDRRGRAGGSRAPSRRVDAGRSCASSPASTGLPGAAQGRGRRRRQRACAAWIARATWNPPSATPRAKPERAFGSAEVYVEKLIEQPRHIEIQTAGRPSRQHDPPGRARVLDPAAPSEGDRGVPVAAGRAASGDAPRDGRRRRFARRAPPATTTPARSSFWWTRPATSISSK